MRHPKGLILCTICALIFGCSPSEKNPEVPTQSRALGVWPPRNSVWDPCWILKQDGGGGTAVSVGRSPDGGSGRYLLTAAHVLDGHPRILNRPVTILATNTEMDIALLYCEIGGRIAKVISDERLISLGPGERVVLVGTRLDSGLAWTEGNYSGLIMQSFPDGPRIGSLFVTAPGTYGVSGGGIFLHSTGELIGIVQSTKILGGVPVEHMMYGTPLNRIRESLEGTKWSFVLR